MKSGRIFVVSAPTASGRWIAAYETEERAKQEQTYAAKLGWKDVTVTPFDPLRRRAMARCGVCGRGNCIPSFHSFAEQEEADRKREGGTMKTKRGIEVGDTVALHDGEPLLVDERGRPGLVVAVDGNQAEVDVELADGTTKRGWFYTDLLEVV